MSTIRSSAELRKRNDEISAIRYSCREPGNLTPHGKSGLAAMTVEQDNDQEARDQLYDEILVGLNEAQCGKTRPFSEAMTDLRERRKRRTIS